MEVLVLPTAADVARRAAEVVIAGLGAARRAEPVIGLATGSSPLGLYAELAAAVRAGSLDLGRARGFALDEYVGLPAGSPAVLPRGAAARGLRAPGAAARPAARAGRLRPRRGRARRRCRRVRATHRRGGRGRRADPRHRGQRPPRLQRARVGAVVAHPGQAAVGPHPARQRPLLRRHRRRADPLRHPGARHRPRRAPTRARRLRPGQGGGRRGRARGSAVGLVPGIGAPVARRRDRRARRGRSRRACATGTTTTPRRPACSDPAHTAYVHRSACRARAVDDAQG